MSCVRFRELVRRMRIPDPISAAARVLEMTAIQNGTGVSSKMEIAPKRKRISSETISNASMPNAVPKLMRIMEQTRAPVDGIANRAPDCRNDGHCGDLYGFSSMQPILHSPAASSIVLPLWAGGPHSGSPIFASAECTPFP